MAAEDIGALYNTKIPGYDDAADIQAALKLFLYGSESYDTANTNPSNLPNPSLARHLKNLNDDITILENLFPGSEYNAIEPVSGDFTPSGIPNGFIWVDGASTAPSIVNFATAVYTNDAPTTGLVDGLIWVDKDSSPQKAYIYNASSSTFVPLNELQNIVDASGDLIYGTADNSVTRLNIGSSGQVLKVSSGLPSWQNEKSWVLKSSGSLSGSYISISGLSNSEKFQIVLKDWSHSDNTNAAVIAIRFNSDAGPNYVNTGGVLSSSALYSSTTSSTSTYDMTIAVELSNTASSLKPVSTNYAGGSQYFGYYKNTDAISSMQIYLSPSGSFDAGTYQVWGYE